MTIDFSGRTRPWRSIGAPGGFDINGPSTSETSTSKASTTMPWKLQVSTSQSPLSRKVSRTGVSSRASPAHDTIMHSPKHLNGTTTTNAIAKDTHQSLWSALASIVKVAILIIFATLYKTKVVDQIPMLEVVEPNSRGKHFRAGGIFSCFMNLHLCLHTGFCMPCRAAHNYQVTGIMDYWPAVILTSLCSCIMPCIGGFHFRPQVRSVIGLDKDPMMDFVTWCLCPACAIGQEALEIDATSGVHVKCCFNVQALGHAEAWLLDSLEQEGQTEQRKHYTAERQTAPSVTTTPHDTTHDVSQPVDTQPQPRATSSTLEPVSPGRPRSTYKSQRQARAPSADGSNATAPAVVVAGELAASAPAGNQTQVQPVTQFSPKQPRSVYKAQRNISRAEDVTAASIDESPSVGTTEISATHEPPRISETLQEPGKPRTPYKSHRQQHHPQSDAAPPADATDAIVATESTHAVAVSAPSDTSVGGYRAQRVTHAPASPRSDGTPAVGGTSGTSTTIDAAEGILADTTEPEQPQPEQSRSHYATERKTRGQ